MLNNKVLILARPDHSIDIALTKSNVKLITWGVLVKKNISTRLLKYVFPKIRIVDSKNIRSSYILTVIHKLIRLLFNDYYYRKSEILLFNTYYFFIILFTKRKVLHLWPLYTSKSILILDKLGLLKRKKILFEIYQAYPKFLIDNSLYKIGEDWSSSKYKLEKDRFDSIVLSYKLVFPSNFIKNSFSLYFNDLEYVIQRYPLERYQYENDFSKTPGNKLNLIYAGQLSKVKGFDILCSLSDFFRDQINITILGDTSDAKLKKELISSGVRILGRVPKFKVQEILSNYDIYIHPTLSDAFSISCCEALGCGLPVITSEYNGIVDVIEKYNAGFIIPGNSLEAFKKVIINLLKDNDVLISLLDGVSNYKNNVKNEVYSIY